MPRVFTAGVDRQSVPRRSRFGRRAGSSRHADPTLLLESRAPAAVRRRDRVFRRALVGADVFSGLLVVGLDIRVFGALGPGMTGLALLPLIVLDQHRVGAVQARRVVAAQEHARGGRPHCSRRRRSPRSSRSCSRARVLATPIGARLFAVTWLGLSVLMLACRVAARAIARGITPSERCLLVGDAAVAARLEAKLSASPNVKASLVGRLAQERKPESVESGLLGTLDDLPRVVAEHHVHRVIVAGDAGSHQRVLEAIQRAKALGDPRKRAAADVRGGRLVGCVRLPRRADDLRRAPLRALARIAPRQARLRRRRLGDSASWCSHRSWRSSPR